MYILPVLLLITYKNVHSELHFLVLIRLTVFSDRLTMSLRANYLLGAGGGTIDGHEVYPALVVTLPRVLATSGQLVATAAPLCNTVSRRRVSEWVGGWVGGWVSG